MHAIEYRAAIIDFKQALVRIAEVAFEELIEGGGSHLKQEHRSNRRNSGRSNQGKSGEEQWEKSDEEPPVTSFYRFYCSGYSQQMAPTSLDSIKH